MNWWTNKTPPRYHSFSPATGEYLESGDCDPSPLEPGVWLTPGHATREMPPTLATGLAAVWTGSKWVATVDRRGEVRWLDGEFVVIKDIGDPAVWGLPDMVVHDAQYILADDQMFAEGVARIRMWVNEDVIEFDDRPQTIARRVLAAWEAKGETIRPIDFDDAAFEPVAPIEPPTSEAVLAARRLAALAADLDKLAQSGVEGIQIPQRGDA